MLVAALLTGLLLGLVYGAEYMLLSTAAVVLLAGAALRGTVIWGKVLPTALGFPGVRLAFVAAEGVCQVGMIVTVTQLWAGPARMTFGLCVGLPVPAGAEHGLLVSCAAGPRRNHAPRERADGAGPQTDWVKSGSVGIDPAYSVMSVHAGDYFLPTVVDAEGDGKVASELWTFPVQGLGSGTSRPRPPTENPPACAGKGASGVEPYDRRDKNRACYQVAGTPRVPQQHEEHARSDDAQVDSDIQVHVVQAF